MEMCDGWEIEDTWWMESFSCGLKMLMLIASYPTILDESTYLQNCIELEKNDAQMLPLFRNWNDFDYHIDLSTCTNIPNGLQNATLTIQMCIRDRIYLDADIYGNGNGMIGMVMGRK